MVTLSLQQFVPLWRYTGCRVCLVLEIKEERLDRSSYVWFGYKCGWNRPDGNIPSDLGTPPIPMK
jgi:hypothetical protein